MTVDRLAREVAEREELCDSFVVFRTADARALVEIVRAARTVLEEVERDLPGRCLICAMPEDDGHTPDCPIPSLRAGFRALDGGS